MTRGLLLALVLLAASPAARAHIGSPNVFFEGHAGVHELRVVIRPPATLPGVAQVDVRVADADVRSVSVQPRLVGDGPASAPAPTSAIPVAGAPGSYSASVWLLRRGAYGVQIEVTSARGMGRVAVPLQAAVLARPDMPPSLGALLVALGALLAGSALWIAGAAGGRRAALGVGAALAAACVGGQLRWQRLDESLANALYQPVPVEAEIDGADGAQRLRVSRGAAAGVPGATWDTLVTDHGKLMHLFLIREGALDAFAHLHPVRRDPRLFEGVVPPLPGGRYELYAELTYETGATETLVAKLDVPQGMAPVAQLEQSGSADVWCLSPAPVTGDAPAPFALDPDDSWHSGRTGGAAESPLMGGGRMVFENAAGLVADRETSLRFSARTRRGDAALLDPYMGMLGHAVVRRSDGSVFTHLHPVGTVSMAATELLARREGGVGPLAALGASDAREVVFPYAFPRAGEYRVWVQLRPRGGGGVVTGVFDVHVADG